jgi:hypothetical protein
MHLWPAGGAVAVVIVEESADRPKLPSDMLAVLTSDALKIAARGVGGSLAVIDQDLMETGPDGKLRVPAVYSPFLGAAKAHGKLPAWTWRQGAGRVQAMDCPKDEATARAWIESKGGKR